MTNELNKAEVRVLEILVEREQFAAAYQYVADVLGPDHKATSWFEAASAINAHANGLGVTARGGYVAVANWVTDLFVDTDPNDDRLFELDNREASNAIAREVLGDIIGKNGDVPDRAVEILERDARDSVFDQGIPAENWVGNHLIDRIMYPELDRSGVETTRDLALRRYRSTSGPCAGIRSQ
ncbi:MAG: hypothetical protein GDA36_12645 [Rhodobacteraceae bacterium]|nr:hypothetical protein [Paracoccaceae bacterium]